MYHNVSFDITTFEGDAIVNSLGIGPRIEVPGRIYRSILNAAKDPLALKKEVTKQGQDLPFTAAYLTDSFGLPCKKIIHAITPFRGIDRKNEQIEQTYKNILKLALDSGLKSICVPLIGTGANGYSSDKVAKIARRACYRFAEEHPDIEVYLNIYSVEVAASRDEEEEDIYPDELSSSYSRPKLGSRRRRDIDVECEGSLGDDLGIPPYLDRPGAQRGDASRPGSAIEEPKPKIPLLDEIGIAFDDSFATLVRKFVFTRTKGSKAKKEDKLEDTWLEINSLVGQFKDVNKKDAPGNAEEAFKKTIETIIDAKDTDTPTDPDVLSPKNSHSVQYEWKKVKAPNGKGYVSQRPNKAEILLTGIGLYLEPEEVMELYEFCGYGLSKYEKYDKTFRDCVQLLRDHKNAWTLVVQQYRHATNESIYAYKEERKKIYTDTGEYW